MNFSHRAFKLSLATVATAAIGWAIWELLHARWAAGVALGGVAAIAASALYFRGRLPPFFGLLLALAALVNAGGYVLTLWHQESAFDEATHFVTSFAGLAAIGWALAGKSRFASRPAMLFLSLLAIGMALGALWEVLEWAIGIIGSFRDTLMDLAMDTVGIAAAGALSLWIASWRR